MCRFVVYQGPLLRLAALVTEPRHSLVSQSAHSTEQRGRTVNGDGFGMAWYARDVGREAAQYRCIHPAWNDDNLGHLARVVESDLVLAHVRAASHASAVAEANCHPFVHGALALMHNGAVGGFPALRRGLLGELSDAAFDVVRGTTDSEVLFATLLDELASGPGGVAGEREADALADALRRTIERVLARVEAHEASLASYLNLAVTDGRSTVVSRLSTEPDYGGESLYVHRGSRYVCAEGACRMVEPDDGGHAVVVSSERLSDDPGWEVVPPAHLVVTDAARVARLVAL